ncbi:Succinate--CoA ligase [GDP-forming] subunit beta [archaeon HR01]|nr:Succinate--CoA ligase [GDP-forming] subunit beta [archaeon HR01]
MKLYEYQARQLFQAYGIPVTPFKVARSVEEAVRAAEELGGRVVVKAQVLVAGRGKAGGVKVAETSEAAGRLAGEMLAGTVKGEKVRSVIVTPYQTIEKELYLAITVERSRRSAVMILSAEGGVEIEELARISPEKLLKIGIDPLIGLSQYQVRKALLFTSLSGQPVKTLEEIIKNLYRLFRDMDCELAEINPLALTPEGGLVALDAKIILDDNALFRHAEFMRMDEGEGFEAEARRLGFSAVELDGDIGIIGNGAGLTMATMDMVKLKGGRPANFLDVGGGASEEVVEKAAYLILSHPRVKVLFVNILAGITRCDEVARGLVKASREVGGGKKIVVRMMGTNEEEGRKILVDSGLYPLDSMEEAAEKAVQLARSV